MLREVGIFEPIKSSNSFNAFRRLEIIAFESDITANLKRKLVQIESKRLT